MPSVQALLMRFVSRNLLRPWLMAGDFDSQRRRFARLAAPRAAVPAAIEEVSAGGVPAEWLTPRGADPTRVIYYIHGGGFVACSPATHRRWVAKLARHAGMRALLVDYRLAPEHPFPAALEDCIAGYRFLLESGIAPSSIVIAGDSAGGALTLTTLLSLRDAGLPLPAAAACISPVTDLSKTKEERQARAHQEALLTPDFGVQATGHYIGTSDARNPLISPAYADLQGLPPLLFHVGTHEILYDDGIAIAERAQQAGVDSTLRVWDGMWHVFHSFDVPESNEAIRHIADFARQHVDRSRRTS